MSIDSNSDVRSKYFTEQTDMDESLSDFQEAKKSCKGPKPAVKPAKSKAKKVTKRAKGQKDIRTALKGKKNELVSYSKEFDTVCKKSGLDVDSEQLQLAIALSKSLQTESNEPETSQAQSTQQRVAKIRKTLQEYGFKVPEAKINVGRKTKKFRKNYKLLTVSEEEKHQNITGKYTRILFENLNNSKVEQNSSNEQESNARVFNIGSSIPYECMKDNKIFYVDNLVEKSTTTGSLLRDWSEIPGRPESPQRFDTYAMNFKDIDCSQDELDIVLSGSIKCTKDIFVSKEIEYKKNYKECDLPKIVVDDEETTVSNDYVAENKSPFKKSFNMESPIKMFNTRSPVKKLFLDKTLAGDDIEIISPIKHPTVKSPSKEVIDVEAINKLTCPQQYRSCSPDIFDDELSSIMETTKPLIVLSQEHKTKVFSQEIMDLTQCANILSQNSERGIPLSQNITKRRSNDFMEITECIVGSSQLIREELKEIDLTQSPEDKGVIIEEDHSINLDDNVDNVSTNFSIDVERNTGSVSQNITDENQITIVSNHPHTDSHETEKENIDLTQSSNEDDRGIPIIEGNVQTPAKKTVENMDLTQSSSSTDTSLPLVDIKNSQSQASLDDTIILDEEKYIANGQVKKSLFGNDVVSQVFDLTQAAETSVEYNPSPVKEINTESCSNSFYEDFIHDHSESTENSKEIVNTDVSKKHSRSLNESKKSDNDIDLTQDSSSSEKILSSQKPITVLENVPNNSSLGKQDDMSIDYDEIIIEDNINDRETFQGSEKDRSVSQHYDSEVNNDIEILCDNAEFKESENDRSLTEQYDSPKSKVNNEIEIVEDNNDADINSSQNSEIFHISDKELDYSLHKSRRDFSKDNFDFGGISVLDNVTKLGSSRKSLSEGCQPFYNENKNEADEDSFLPEVYVKKTEPKINETTQLKMDKDGAISPIRVQEVLKSNNGIINIRTPNNTEYIIKTVDVTPMADYASMSTPQRNRELDKYGVKPLKRKKAIQMLTHLYNKTHPTIQQLEEEFQPSPSKKPRTNTYTQESPPKRSMTSPENSPSKVITKTPVKSQRKFVYKKGRQEKRVKASETDELERDGDILSAPSPIRSNELEIESNRLSVPFSNRLDELERDSNSCSATSSKRSDELDRDRDNFSAPSTKTDAMKGVADVCVYEVTNEVAVVKTVDCGPEDWVFQKREKAKIHSCRVPLHIAFQNYVLSRRSLWEAILKYEPVNIDVIHKDLVGYGHRYDPKDLLKFLDKKCITVKTTDNNARNNRR